MSSSASIIQDDIVQLKDNEMEETPGAVGDQVQQKVFKEEGKKRVSQLRALLWKNFTLKRKRQRSTCCEIFVPVFFILLIIALKGLTQIEVIPEGWSEDFTETCPYTNRNATSPLVQVPCPVHYENFLRLDDNYFSFFSRAGGRDNTSPFGRICLAYSGSTTQRKLLDDFVEFVATKGIIETGPVPEFRNMVLFIGSGTEEELVDYIKSPTYGLPFSEASPQCTGALVLDAIDFSKAQFKYTIRGNATDASKIFEQPETNGETVEFQKFLSDTNIGDYSSDGWFNLQALFDSYLIETTFEHYTEFPLKVAPSSRKVQKERLFFQRGKSRALPMPIESFTRDVFFTLVQEILPLIFVVVYLMPVSQIIAVIVLEKEVRAREMMRLMGVSDFKIVSSWFVTYIVFFLFLSVFFAIGGGLMFPSTTEAAGGFSFVIFFIFFSFGLSVIAFSFVVSTLFKKAFNAVVFGLMTYIILFFLFYFFNERFVIPTGPLLIPQIAFGFTIQTLAIFEETGIGISGDLVGTDILGFNVGRGIGMMLFDTFYLTILGFYLNAVIPGEFGSAWPFYFPLLPKYWKKAFASLKADVETIEAPDATELEAIEGELIEEPNEALKSQIATGVGVQIRGMSKVFNTPDGEKVAVDNLNLDVFEGQILVLLGHNGAGKTTTLQMLTGSLSMTNGEAYIYGNRVRTDLGAIRKSLGFCPQHDVLYKELTVYDHLKFYGKIKSITGKELETEIDESLVQVGLTEKKFVKSKNLSGGMKRKLSLAISLIGKSKVIFVDEPTSGVDTFSRRSMWEILQNARQGRVIILTTHFMDEADLLGDRIAIMAEGELQCVGSSFFLKQEYGAGYRLVFTKKKGCDSTMIEELVEKHVANATKASEVGTELSFHLPVQESHSFADLFSEIDELMEAGTLLVSSYGVSVTTMEEVFLKAGQSEDLLEGAKEILAEDKGINTDKHIIKGKHEAGVFESNNFSMFLRQFWAMFLKRIRYARRDRYSCICNTFVPVTIFCIGLLVLTFTDAFDDMPPLEMSTIQLNPTFPVDKRGFMPIVEMTSTEVLEFGEGRFSQQANFPQFILEEPVEKVTEFSGFREVFNRTYSDGQIFNCISPFCTNREAPGRIGNTILDIGKALLDPNDQFLKQVNNRNGASLFASAIFLPEIEDLNTAGCFFAEFGFDLVSGVTIGQTQVQCTDNASPCVMLEMNLKGFLGNDFFTCIPAGCLSDLNDDVLDTLLSFITGDLPGVDNDFVETLITESEIFICEDRLCNIGPGSLNDFSICRGGSAFAEDEFCVVDDLIALETELLLSEDEQSLDITIDIDRNASYCEGKDVSGISIDDFINEDSLEVKRMLQNETVESCFNSGVNDELISLIQFQADIESANAEFSFDATTSTCVDEEFECRASVLPVTNQSSLCIVSSCVSEADRQLLTEDLLGSGGGTQLVLGIIDNLQEIPCNDVATVCDQTIDYPSSVQIINALVINNSLDNIFASGLADLILELAQETLNPANLDFEFDTQRILQEVDVLCKNNSIADCNVINVNGICAELTCEEQLELFGLPPGTTVENLIALAAIIEGLEVNATACDDLVVSVQQLNCSNDVIFSLESLGLDVLLNAFLNAEVATVQDVIQLLDSLTADELSGLATVANVLFNTTIDGAQLDQLFSLLNENFALVEILLSEPDLVSQILEAAVNSAENEVVNCTSITDECLLVELDLNFGKICLPAGCSSSFGNNNLTREVAIEMDSSFNGITTFFTCAATGCNSGCEDPSNCESDLLQPILPLVAPSFQLIPESRVCRVLRAGFTLLLNSSANHITAIAFGELHTAVLRRSLVEYFNFSAEEFIGLDVSFQNTSNKFDVFEAGQIGDPTVKFVFPDEASAPRIVVTAHPLPFTQSAQEVFDAIIAFTTAIFCLLAYAFIPGPMISFVVMEKEEDIQIKHLQFVSGAGVFAYWLSNYVFDIISFLIPFTISLLLIKLFDVSSFIENGAFEVVAVVLFGYGVAIIPFSYLFGHLFKKHTTALIWIIIINCITGLTLMIASFAMDQVPETVDINQSLKWIYRFSPGFCLGDSLLNIAITGLTIGLLGDENSPGFYDQDVTGANITYLYLEAILFFLVVVFIEFATSNAVLSKYLSFKNIKNMILSRQNVEMTEEFEVDEDVKAEADRVLERTEYEGNNGIDAVEAGAKPDVLEMINLRKVYGNGKVAVKGVSLGVPEGECFGYLGINGAGKTTTLKCLTGDIFPTTGNGFISGHSIVTEQWAVRRNVGYCSQFSSILGLLTVREHLELFCRIKQVIDVEDNVQKLLRRLSLTPFENKLAKSLSGGNKRKLSVAIAMIGSPAVMLLDEPSTGMDVASRRFMWNVIENMVAGRYDGKKTSVILTTHSMEECEALCSRVGIMVGGRMRCLGSIQHLKSRFGRGYTVEAKINNVTKEEVMLRVTRLNQGGEELITSIEFDSFLEQFEEKNIIARITKGTDEFGSAMVQKVLSGGVHVNLLVEWILQQQKVNNFEVFLKESFEGVELVEAHEYNVTYRIEKRAQTKLSTLFEAMENNKLALEVAEYSVSQTTLEQIFNGFAAQQEEEQRTPQGMFRSPTL